MATYPDFSYQRPSGGSSAYWNYKHEGEEVEEDTKPITFSLESINPQSDCPLFSRIPPEIRSLIFEYALKDYEDKIKLYEDATSYKRPDSLAPRRTDTELLRTCKRIYTEAWYLPWASAEHSFYLAWAVRSPPSVTSVRKMQRVLNALHVSHVEPTVGHVKVFAQLCELEGGGKLMEIMDMKYFHPKVVTITIRHTDWWEWEMDMPLRFGEKWVDVCVFPESMKELRIAFESLERKKASVDQVAEQAIKKWEFERKDGVIMSAEGCVPSIMRWSGASTWEGRRWLRDETKPNQLDYYVATVTWRPVMKEPASVLPTGAADSQAPRQRKRKTAKPLQAEEDERLITDMDSVLVAFLEHAGVPEHTPADEVQRLLRDYREMNYSVWDPEEWYRNFSEEDENEYSLNDDWDGYDNEFNFNDDLWDSDDNYVEGEDNYEDIEL